MAGSVIRIPNNRINSKIRYCNVGYCLNLRNFAGIRTRRILTLLCVIGFFLGNRSSGIFLCRTNSL